MKFQIIYDESMPGCYAVGKMGPEGREKAVFVSEQEGNGEIVRINLKTLEKEILSKEPGGGMNIVELPGEKDSFLAIQKFFPVFRSDHAVVVWGRREEDGYRCREVQRLPFVHRIDVIKHGGRDYLLAASLCETKKYTDDWDYPGSVYAGLIDYENQRIADFQPICSNIVKNHGFTKIGRHGEQGVLISGECGVFLLTPPGQGETEWGKEVCIATPSSDAVVADIDGDGEWEIGVISPFHGEEFRIYKRINNKWQEIYALFGSHEFGHAIWGGQYEGKGAFLAGFRAGKKELYLITMENGSYVASLVEEGGGPANVTVAQGEHGDYICAANRQSDRMTIYKKI